MRSLGLGKTLFNSSVCLLDQSGPELYLTERILRKKASGAWPSVALKILTEKTDLLDVPISENRDVEDPLLIEEALNKQFPFFDHLKATGLANFSRQHNSKIKYVTHHRAHAAAAAYMSPFESCLILVIDGAGSRVKYFDVFNPEYTTLLETNADPEAAEERTLYAFENGQLICLEKHVQIFKKGELQTDHYFSEGLGSFYEKISEYIFNSKRDAGKVMGLAALGNANAPHLNYSKYLEQLDWALQYKGHSKMAWESSPHLAHYQTIAADAQTYFEADYVKFLCSLKERYPNFSNLIITGGCALNCTSNMKIYESGFFDEVYIPPFPGDESIGLGCAFNNVLAANPFSWNKNPFHTQHGYFGPHSSIPNEFEILKAFDGFEIIKPENIAEYSAQMLADGHIIGWFQGRSESGPRALGNRSILVRPDKKGIKDHLNTHIKFREAFRPYGCSVVFEKSHEYFKVPKGFNNPYMSFAVQVQTDYLEALKEVTHVDGTSRMQTVRPMQNTAFFELLMEFGARTNLYCLLNTSLNVMGEPIVESVADAANFLENVPVYGMAIGEYFIKKNI